MHTGNSVTNYYCCPESYFHIASRSTSYACKGYFSLGTDATCYGYYDGHYSQSNASVSLHDALERTTLQDGTIYLPFDPDEVVGNLRRELYVTERKAAALPLLKDLYYLLRPALPVHLRKHIQQFHFRHRHRSTFPRWPVDCSVDNIFSTLMLLALRASGAERIPFIWFWPDAKSSSAIMTHDVESIEGRDFCSNLMDIDDAHGIKSSFQIVPEERYHVSERFLNSLRQRGFEIAVHDLNHDGYLYHNRSQFLRRAEKINEYLELFQTTGFRAGVLYRKQLWYDALRCSYDMSVPNAARFDPQPGGCCTVMPYFVGDVLEIPVTTVQDYTLFHILNDYSIDLWKRQAEEIMRKHGLMSFIVHPDYIMQPLARQGYESLLEYLKELESANDVWITTPAEVNRWWRQRVAMRIAKVDGGWEIQGDGSERARIAYASEANGMLTFTISGPSDTSSGWTGKPYSSNWPHSLSTQ